MIGQSIYSFNLKTFLQVVFTCALEPRRGLFTVCFALELSDVPPDDVSRLYANSAHRLNIFTSQKRQHFQLVSMYGRRGSTKMLEQAWGGSVIPSLLVLKLIISGLWAPVEINRLNKHEVGEYERSTKKCLLEHYKEEKEYISQCLPLARWPTLIVEPALDI